MESFSMPAFSLQPLLKQSLSATQRIKMVYFDKCRKINVAFLGSYKTIDPIV